MFLLFAGHDYYPDGGIEDYIGCFSSIHEAQTTNKLKPGEAGWANIAQVSFTPEFTVHRIFRYRLIWETKGACWWETFTGKVKWQEIKR